MVVEESLEQMEQKKGLGSRQDRPRTLLSLLINTSFDDSDWLGFDFDASDASNPKYGR